MTVYQGNFTTYFSTWLKDNSLEVDGVVTYPHKDLVENLLQVMPDLPFTTRNGENESMTFAQRFIERNYYKEIGSETYELFEMHLTNKAREVASLYAEKIRLQIENISKLYDRFIKIEDSNSFEESGEDERLLSDFYNPVEVSFSENNSNIDSASRNNVSYNKSSTEIFKRNKLFSFLKTNGQVMDEINKVEIMYEQALQYLDRLFMVIL